MNTFPEPLPVVLWVVCLIGLIVWSEWVFPREKKTRLKRKPRPRRGGRRGR